jgi:hypothetical protein
MPALHDGHFWVKVALAVKARCVSGSLLAEGKEGTLLGKVARSSRHVLDAHGVARAALMFRGRVAKTYV